MRLLRNNRGQGMTEYIIIVALVAIAAIAGFAYFGKTIRGQTAEMSASIAGDKPSNKDTEDGAKGAKTEAEKSANLKTYIERTNTN